ncbi:cell division topological specificity factor MinE [Candidatus Palibaumannia cicadellinicola]|uniref:Cell division topological specificity factor n=1 Tax=Candidatus Palibaumannia cicadellinicola TaxID=186490 RepID=A0A0K2BLB5_9GAMM|nr:cell division topological specificity factor MinE [Candidatus Baumannia cicadellinicola]AKZ65987.1 cell division topological specificity factor [Candidatus Baumannia cicadellinicola]
MELFNFCFSRKQTPANLAKQRLQIIVAEQRKSCKIHHYVPQLKYDLLQVLYKYLSLSIYSEVLSVQLNIKHGDVSIIDLQINLPEIANSLQCRK